MQSFRQNNVVPVRNGEFCRRVVIMVHVLVVVTTISVVIMVVVVVRSVMVVILLSLGLDQDWVHVVHHLVIFVILDDLPKERDVPVLLVQQRVVGGIFGQRHHVGVLLHHLVIFLVILVILMILVIVVHGRSAIPESPAGALMVLVFLDHLLHVRRSLEEDVLKELECFEDAVGGPHDLVIVGVDGGDVRGRDVLDMFVAMPDGRRVQVLKAAKLKRYQPP